MVVGSRRSGDDVLNYIITPHVCACVSLCACACVRFIILLQASPPPPLSNEPGYHADDPRGMLVIKYRRLVHHFYRWRRYVALHHGRRAARAAAVHAVKAGQLQKYFRTWVARWKGRSMQRIKGNTFGIPPPALPPSLQGKVGRSGNGLMGGGAGRRSPTQPHGGDAATLSGARSAPHREPSPSLGGAFGSAAPPSTMLSTSTSPLGVMSNAGAWQHASSSPTLPQAAAASAFAPPHPDVGRNGGIARPHGQAAHAHALGHHHAHRHIHTHTHTHAFVQVPSHQQHPHHQHWTTSVGVTTVERHVGAAPVRVERTAP